MDHKDLDVWKRGIELVEMVYEFTKDFPDSERYGLTSQIRRAAVSIPSNIAEGSARKSDKELLHYISVALGSLAELETHYIVAIRIGFVKEEVAFSELITDEKKLLLGYRNYIKNKLH